MRLPTSQRKRRLTARRAEGVTVGLALFAAGSAGTLITGELLRLARRRRASKETETPETLAEAARHGSRGTLAGARRGMSAAPHHGTVLFNILEGFLGPFAVAGVAACGILESFLP